MAEASVNEVPTVDALLLRNGLMQHCLLDFIRKTVRNDGLEVSTRLQRIAWYCDMGLQGPQDERARILYEQMARELERIATILHRLDGY